MGKLKTTGKKSKAVTSKKVSASDKTPSRKPIKLGGVPNQGTVLQQEVAL